MATSSTIYPEVYNNPDDQSPVSATHVQGAATSTAATGTNDLIAIGTQTASQEFHLTHAKIYIDRVTTTGHYDLMVGAQTVTTFPSVKDGIATSTNFDSRYYDLDFGPVGIIWTTDSTTAAVTFHMSCATKTATTGHCFAIGYLK